MRVTEKGQVTIPKEIRDHLGIKPGSEVSFIAANDGALLVKADGSADDVHRRKFGEWANRVEGTLDLGGMSTDDYMIWLRGDRDDLGSR